MLVWSVQNPINSEESVAARLRQIKGIDAVHVVVEEPRLGQATVRVTACFEARDYGAARVAVGRAVYGNRDYDKVPTLVLEWARNKTLLELSRVHKAAVKAFPERVHESVVNGEVRVSISGDTVHIRLDANEIFSHRTRATWAARINELKLPLPEGVKHLRADAGALDARPHYPQFDHVDDDGDVDTNPNWPSKTGNPSGGGRGNNPPR